MHLRGSVSTCLERDGKLLALPSVGATGPLPVPSIDKGMLSTRGSIAADSTKVQDVSNVLANLYQEDSNINGILSLGVADNTLMRDVLVDFINSTFQLQEFALTYGDGPAGNMRLRKALASFLNRHFEPARPIIPAHVHVTNGVTSCLEGLGFALGDPGDAILLGRPYYGSYPYDLQKRAGIIVVDVFFGNTDPMSLEAVEDYEKVLKRQKAGSHRVRALLLASPHNPLGRCYSQATLLAYMRLCQKYQIHLISDEVFALSTFRNDRFPNIVPFTSVLAIDSASAIDPHLLHVLWGFSKDFGASGLRIGCIISQANPSLLRTFESNGFPSGVAESVAASILESPLWTDWYIATSRLRLAEAYNRVTSFLDREDVPYHEGGNAGFFVWCDLGAVWLRNRSASRVECGSGGHTSESKTRRSHGLTATIMQALMDRRLFLASGDTFGSEIPGWFRIVFTQPMDFLDEGLDRMIQALKP